MAFPHGAILTWQGYKHGLPQVGTGPPEAFGSHSKTEIELIGGYGAADCNRKLVQYLKTGELPSDGTCPIDGLNPGWALKLERAIVQINLKGACLNNITR